MGDRSNAHSYQLQYTWVYLNLPKLEPKQRSRSRAPDIQRREHQPSKNIEIKFMREYNNKRKSCKDTMKVLPTSNYTRQVIDARKPKLRERPLPRQLKKRPSPRQEKNSSPFIFFEFFKSGFQKTFGQTRMDL
jgi:hypothetical protein